MEPVPLREAKIIPMGSSTPARLELIKMSGGQLNENIDSIQLVVDEGLDGTYVMPSYVEEGTSTKTNTVVYVKTEQEREKWEAVMKEARSQSRPRDVVPTIVEVK